MPKLCGKRHGCLLATKLLLKTIACGLRLGIEERARTGAAGLHIREQAREAAGLVLDAERGDLRLDACPNLALQSRARRPEYHGTEHHGRGREQQQVESREAKARRAQQPRQRHSRQLHSKAEVLWAGTRRA